MDTKVTLTRAMAQVLSKAQVIELVEMSILPYAMRRETINGLVEDLFDCATWDENTTHAVLFLDGATDGSDCFTIARNETHTQTRSFEWYR